MGNDVQRLQAGEQDKQKRIAKIFTQPERNHLNRPSLERNCQQEGKYEEGTYSEEVEKGKRKCNLDNSTQKHKKYISLIKQSAHGNNKLKNSNYSTGKQKKGIKLTPSSQSHLKYSIAQVINYEDPNTGKGREPSFIKKSFIRPRDLPRHSSQKIIPSSLASYATTQKIPSARVISNEYNPPVNRFTFSTGQPQININYACPLEHRPHTESSHVNTLQSSTVVPFRAVNTAGNWMPKPVDSVDTKKLKKVPMTRSFQSNPVIPNPKPASIVENQEQSMFVKQVSDLTQLRHNMNELEQKSRLPAESSKLLPSKKQQKMCKQQNKQNDSLFSDLHLISPITNESKAYKQTESKYAVAYEQNGVYIEHLLRYKPLSESITKDTHRSIHSNKYSLAVDKWLAADYANCQLLEEKVEREVLSNPVIEQPFRFPTATDISYEERSDNTSFIPITKNHHNDSASYIQLQGEDLLQYCKPNINSRIMADLLKLPLKS